LEGKILLRGCVALKIGDFQIAFDVNAKATEIFPVVGLDFRTVQYRGLHAVTERTVSLLEKNQHALLVVVPRQVEFFLEVAEGLVEESLSGVRCRDGAGR